MTRAGAIDGGDELLLPNAAAWRAWLAANHERAPDAWLVLAKKGVTSPTSVTYEEAVCEALCFGWIDGAMHGRDAITIAQRFTPRRPRSAWSPSNVARVERLIAGRRMHAAGLAAVDAAKKSGRWPGAAAPAHADASP